MSFPRLVERLDPHTSLTLGCDQCEHTWQAKDSDDFIAQIGFSGRCPKCRGWKVFEAYTEAPKCKGCGALGHWDEALNFCCSRCCMLQAEYAKTLGGAA